MRSIGVAERALELHILRITDPSRKTFGKLIAQHGTAAASVALSRLEIDQARLLVLNAAASIDKWGPKKAMKEIGMAKIVVPSMTCRVIDRAIQAHGAAGISQDTVLALMYAQLRTLRFADGNPVFFFFFFFFLPQDDFYFYFKLTNYKLLFIHITHNF